MRTRLLLALGSLVVACNGADRPLGTMLDRPQFNVSAPAGVSGRIAWNTDRDGGPDQDIWIMNADGSRATQLTQNDGIDDGSPSWSPDGKRIAFHSTRDGDYEVFVMNADGSGVTQLTDNASADNVPVWSPDGRKLVFASDRDGDLEVLIMNADGTGVRQVTHNACSEYNPAWSPGGKRIAFASDCDGDWEIYVMGVDGSAVTRLTDNTTTDDSPAWSPDGKRLAFGSERDGDSEIYVMNVDGTAVTQLTNNGAIEFIPAWSPDGKRLVFTSNRDGDFELFVMNADGTGVSQLTSDGFADFGIAWTAGTITGPATQFHFVANGDFGNVNWFEVDAAGGFTFGSLSVNRGGPTTDPQTFLSYFVFQCDPFFSCNAVRDGFGLIPNRDLSGGGNSLSLRTNTTGNPNFTTFAGPTGLVSVDWRANGLFTQSSSGTNQFSFPGFTQRSQGSFTSASANATGSIVEVPVGSPTQPDSSGIGTNHQVIIDIARTSATADSGPQLDAAATGQSATANADAVSLLPTGTVSNSPTQFHFVANGGFGNVNWFEFDAAGGFTFGSLSVSRGGPTTDPQTFLSYFVFQCDPFFSCNAVRDGFGLIPNRDLSGGGNSLSLRTNTTGNPNFTTFAGPTGLVSVDWRANGLFTQSSSGTNQFSFPGFTQRSQGSFTSASANAAGSIVGVPIAPTASGDIGTSHQTTIDFIRTPTGGGGACVAPPDGLRAWWPGDGDGRDLIGSNHANGNFNVFVMKTSGSPPTQLTDVPGYNARPSWSHDGRRITFTACRVTDSSCEIYVMNADGSGQTKLTDDFSADFMSVWSPDDRRIAFVSERDGSPQIYVMNADGSNPIRLTDAGGEFPTWSPDGTRIAFQTNRDGNNEVYVMNADGSNPTNLTQGPAADEFPAWSPGGGKIAFRSDRDGSGEIYTMNVDGSQPNRLTSNPADEYYPAWSPTGTRVAFASNRDGNYEIYVMQPDGSGQRRVTDDPAWDADPAWATDQLLAFASAQATFAPAKVREGFSFGRAGEGVFTFGAGIDDLQQLTIDAWVKHNALPFGRIQRYVTLPDEKAVLRYDGVSGFAQLHFYMRINGELQHIRVDNALQAGVFHHVAGSYDGSIMRLYLDGVEVGSLAVPGALNSGFGVLFSSGEETLDGVLDEIDIFGHALDAAEVRAIFEAGKAGKCKNAPAT